MTRQLITGGTGRMFSAQARREVRNASFKELVEPYSIEGEPTREELDALKSMLSGLTENFPTAQKVRELVAEALAESEPPQGNQSQNGGIAVQQEDDSFWKNYDPNRLINDAQGTPQKRRTVNRSDDDFWKNHDPNKAIDEMEGQ